MDQPTNSSSIKKKEISWKEEYLEKVILQNVYTRSQGAILEKKASIGPCFKPNIGGPSGITVCVPKKSIRSVKEECVQMQSVINFNVSKKLKSKSASFVGDQCQRGAPRKCEPHKHKDTRKKPEKEVTIKLIEPSPKFIDSLRGKIDAMTSKIRNLLNI